MEILGIGIDLGCLETHPGRGANALKEETMERGIPRLIDAMQNEGDFYVAVAAEMFDKDIACISVEERNMAKTRILRALYGWTPKSFIWE